MKYPYIGKWEYINTTVIFTDENAGIEIGGEMSFRDDWTEINYKNITTEYLANTYGEVESKEHAEFIVKLSGGDSSSIGNSWNQSLKCFVIDSDGMVSFGNRVYYQEKVGKRLITIPLPPESNTNTPEEDFEMTQVAKNNGDNLIFGGDDKCKEWPCVNDEVLTSDGKGVVRLLSDSKGYYVVSINDEYYQYQLYQLEKPKTPEQELRDELVELALSHIENKEHPIEANAYYLVSEIIEKYIKKPQ